MVLGRLGSSSLSMDVIKEHCLPGESRMTALITGGNQGLGFETATALAKAGCRVIISSRNVDSGRGAVAQICATANCPEDTVMALQLDLTDLTSIQTFVHSLRNERLDIILCNAGVMAPPYTLTKHDFELQMATNHHGHFYLMELLTPKLKAQPFKSRLVMVSSAKHRSSKGPNLDDLHCLKNRKAYSPMRAYEDTKLANILFAKEYDRRHSNTNAFSVDPGRCPATNLSRYTGMTGMISNMAFRTYCKSPAGAAATIVFTAVSRDLSTGMGGAYLEDCRPASPSKVADDPELGRRLWEVTAAEIQTALAKVKD